ncbi:carbon-nitrogen hydrolase family protein [Rhizobium sp. Root1204]|uniref:carbon-nitrogen hydrolase family protein n=1 Tax=Rhizobium sp. Root1204 TaxID=1736428 RepID=UPI000713478A|nr:carbon-nitrogen hydrolase family protein [Rhizobium sp. Root1204]KQV41350.1 amidohydrolase [Rhizobium sp. Root1204]
MKKIKAAAVQASSAYMNLDASIDKVEKFTKEAAANGAELVAFPECFLPGYPWFVWLMPPVQWAKFMPQYHENSLKIDSPEFERIRKIAADSKVTLVVGFSERAQGSRYIAQAIIGPDGKVLQTRRKLKPTHAERMVFGEGDGSDLRVIETPFGRLGALNCWEHIQPLTKMAMYAQHEEIHVASWPTFCNCRDEIYSFGPEVNNAITQTYAVEGSCYVIAPSCVTGQDVFDLICETPEQRQMLNTRTAGPGGAFSMIFGPDGRPLCDPIPEDQEGILYAELDPHQVIMAKSGADPVGHYSRPDTLALFHDRRKKTVVRATQFDEVRDEADVETDADAQTLA